jgi:hypothetical protein
MNKRNDWSSPETMLNCGIIPGRLRSGGVGIGEGGSSSKGILFISLFRLREQLGLLLFQLGFLGGLL